MHRTSHTTHTRRRFARHAAWLVAAGLIGGCSKTEYPRYELNPAPKDSIQLAVKLKNAPADMYASAAYAAYKIINRQCLPVVTNLEGVQHAPDTHYVYMTPRRVDANTYVFTVYRDQMKRKAYYGRGTCEWELSLAGSNFKLRDAKENYHYSGVATPEEFQSDGGYTLYYRAKGARPSDGRLQYVDSSFGKNLFDNLSAKDQAEALSINISSVR
ncbi:hypothetical protein [Stenotrophomonas sp.]|uniref:hypothetical protein n=1 Tax=Stenotrophomonas sp. TaxID=69392 RepID=UPI002FC7D8C7